MSSYQGKIVGNVYVFNTLYSKNTRGKLLFWTAFIRLVDKQTLAVEYDNDWDKDRETVLPILDEYFNSKPMNENIVAQLFTERGEVGGKVVRNPPTIIKEGSPGLKGKKNARNVLTQALINCNSLYNKKITDGYSLDKEFKSNVLYFAMAAKLFDDEVDKITYPCLSQPKLDGCRCITKLDNGKVVRYSRDLKIWEGFEIFDKYLIEILKTGAHLDGELYLHGKHLQEIVGVARNKDKAFQLKYYIFDVFYPNKNVQAHERLMWLSTLRFSEESNIVIVETSTVSTRKELDTLYKEYIKNGYEGQMIRKYDGLYETSTMREPRSANLIKRKVKYDNEYKLVHAECGTNGRAAGTFIGVFEVNKIKFKASFKSTTMKVTKEYYKDYLSNPSNWIGKMFTIEYDDLSKDNIPLRPKIVALREVL